MYECEDCRECPVRSQCTRATSGKNRQILVKNSWRYFKVECKKKLLDETTGTIYRRRKIEVELGFGHLKAHWVFHRFHLRGKLGAKIDVDLALMALNLRKLGRHMERKALSKEKTETILIIIVKIVSVFYKEWFVPLSNLSMFFCKVFSGKLITINGLSQNIGHIFFSKIGLNYLCF